MSLHRRRQKAETCNGPVRRDPVRYIRAVSQSASHTKTGSRSRNLAFIARSGSPDAAPLPGLAIIHPLQDRMTMFHLLMFEDDHKGSSGVKRATAKSIDRLNVATRDQGICRIREPASVRYPPPGRMANGRPSTSPTKDAGPSHLKAAPRLLFQINGESWRMNFRMTLLLSGLDSEAKPTFLDNRLRFQRARPTSVFRVV